MNRSKHAQRPAAPGWNPPPMPHQGGAFDSPQSVASAGECTGLEPRPAQDRHESSNYSELYAIHAQKPQGNIGKGNPRNDPRERHFHRQ